MIRKYLHIVLISAITLLGVALSSKAVWAPTGAASDLALWQLLVLTVGLSASLTAGRQALKRIQTNIVYR